METGRRVTWREALTLIGIFTLAAAVPVAAAIRSRVASNEATAIADIRTVIAAQAAYSSVNGGWYEYNFACLATHGACIPMAPASTPTFLDSQLAALTPKTGYIRAIGSLGGGPQPPDPTVSTTSVSTYVYTASPSQQGQTGVRGFGGDASGIVCFSEEGMQTPSSNGQLTVGPYCKTLK